MKVKQTKTFVRQDDGTAPGYFDWVLDRVREGFNLAGAYYRPATEDMPGTVRVTVVGQEER